MVYGGTGSGEIPAVAVTSGQARAIFVLGFLAGMIDGYDLQSAGLIAPKLATEFGMGPGYLGAIFGLTALALMVGSTLGGWLGDIVGPKQALIAALAFFGICSIGSAFAWTALSFGVFRASTGFGLGMALPNIIAIISAISPRETIARRVALITASVPLGGVLLGGLVYLSPGQLSWRHILHVGGWLPLLIAVLIIFIFPNIHPGRSAAADDDRSAAGRSRFRMLFQREPGNTLLLWLAFFVTMGVLYILVSWLPTILTDAGISSREIGLVMLCFSVAGAVGGILAGWMISAFSHRAAAFACYLGSAAGFACLVAGHNTLSLALLTVGTVSFFITAAQFFLYATSPMLYPPEIRGTGVGSAISAGRLGAAAGPSLAGLALNSGASADAMLLSCIPVIFLAFAIVLYLLVRARATLSIGATAG